MIVKKIEYDRECLLFVIFVCVWKRSALLQGKVFDTGLTAISDMSKTTCTSADVAREWWTRDGQNVVQHRLCLLSHCISIWPIFCTDIHCRQRQKKTNAFQWVETVSVAPYITDVHGHVSPTDGRNRIISLLLAVYASESCSFVQTHTCLVFVSLY